MSNKQYRIILSKISMLCMVLFALPDAMAINVDGRMVSNLVRVTLPKDTDHPEWVGPQTIANPGHNTNVFIDVRYFTNKDKSVKRIRIWLAERSIRYYEEYQENTQRYMDIMAIPEEWWGLMRPGKERIRNLHGWFYRAPFMPDRRDPRKWVRYAKEGELPDQWMRIWSPEMRTAKFGDSMDRFYLMADIGRICNYETVESNGNRVANIPSNSGLVRKVTYATNNGFILSERWNNTGRTIYLYSALQNVVTANDIYSGIPDCIDIEPEGYVRNGYAWSKIGQAKRFGGVGLNIKKDDMEQLVVVRVMNDSPASSMGIREGDRIVSIGGISINNKAMGDIVDMIRGLPGTSVNITIERNNQTNDYELIRDRFLKTD